MRESATWRTVRDGLAPWGYVGRLENSVALGWPDVAFCLKAPARPATSGWLELKRLDTWPARASTAVRVDHLTVEQVTFLEDWTAAGGRAWLLLHVAREWLLLDAATARALHGRELTRAQLVARAEAYWIRFRAAALVGSLTRPILHP